MDRVSSTALREAIFLMCEEGGAGDLIDVVLRLRVRTAKESDPQVADIMTNIRVIKGVAIVRQVEPILRIQGGHDVLQLGVKYMPSSKDFEKVVTTLGRAVRKVPGVDISMVLTVGGRPVRKKDGSPYIW